MIGTENIPIDAIIQNNLTYQIKTYPEKKNFNRRWKQVATTFHKLLCFPSSCQDTSTDSQFFFSVGGNSSQLFSSWILSFPESSAFQHWKYLIVPFALLDTLAFVIALKLYRSWQCLIKYSRVNKVMLIHRRFSALECLLLFEVPLNLKPWIVSLLCLLSRFAFALSHDEAGILMLW